jgi:hypothetical protein
MEGSNSARTQGSCKDASGADPGNHSANDEGDRGGCSATEGRGSLEGQNTGKEDDLGLEECVDLPEQQLERTTCQ